MFLNLPHPGRLARILALGLAATITAPTVAQAPTTQPMADLEDARYRDEARRLIARGTRFLLVAQEPDGGWESRTGPGITALSVQALARDPRIGPNHPAVQRGVTFVLGFLRPEGGLYSAEGLLKNYESAVALMMLAALGDARHAEQITRLQTYLKDLQWDESENYSSDHPWYGGAGYGNHGRPDLSNTQMLLEALHDSGLPPDDPAFQKALIFIQRCQMHGEYNDQEFARGSTQGGFIYSPHAGGETRAGQLEVAGRTEHRAFGSMTYAAFKSLLYAGLEHDDPRVRAALDWMKAHWTLDYNPNMPERQSREGLFYYYHVFARALHAWGAPTITDNRGRTHTWRHELVTKLATLQQPDGSWINEADRYMEGLTPLTTAYALLALHAAYPAEHTAEPASPPPTTQPTAAPRTNDSAGTGN